MPRTLWFAVLFSTACDIESTDLPADASAVEGSIKEDTSDFVEMTEEIGPQNSWWHADQLPEGLAGTGYSSGDTAHDFRLIDQHGDEVQLYQFYGQVIVLELFVSWCGVCEELADFGEALWTELADHDMVYLSVMLEDYSGQPPSPEDAEEWAARFGLTHPVLADDGTGQRDYIQVGYPTFVIIDRDMTIIDPDFWPLDEGYIRSLILD